MARLSLAQVQELIRSPKNRDYIQYACRQEERLKLHAEPILQKGKLPPTAYLEYTTWIKSLVTVDKTARVLSLLNTPFETVAVTKNVFDQLGKFFDAQDRFVKNEFTDPELATDFNDYLESIGDAEFWPTRGMTALRIAINSLIVCDLPATQDNERPKPYYFLLHINNVIDVDINEESGKVEYVIFKKDDETVVEIDDEFYRVYKITPKNKPGGPEKQQMLDSVPYVGHLRDANYKPPVDNIDLSDITLKSENAHTIYANADSDAVIEGVGYCPVTDFYGIKISNTRQLDKRGPITDVLTKLDFLLFFATLAKYYFLYGPFPIICSFKIKDKYLDDKNAETTDTGAQQLSLNQFNAYDLVAVDVVNPRTQPRNLIGPGTSITGAPPQREGDPNMFENGGPLKVIEMSVANLEWVRSYVEYLGDNIIEICTGRRPQVNNAAKNEDQVGEGLEAQKSILDTVGAQFERAHKFTMKTLAILRYGRKKYISTTVDYGSEYFLKDAEQLTSEYDAAVKAGLNSGYTYALMLAVITTRFKNNPDELARQKILLDLEPYLGSTWKDMQAAGMDVIDWPNFVIKLNFNNFISKFETDYTNVVTFMSGMEYKKKIAFINEVLKSYTNEYRQPVAEPAGTGGN